MRLVLRFACCLVILTAPLAAFADCVHEGQTYPEGTRLGPYVCQNGEWVPG